MQKAIKIIDLLIVAICAIAFPSLLMAGIIALFSNTMFALACFVGALAVYKVVADV